MLVLTRKPGETLLIEPHPETQGADPQGWFTHPIKIQILRIQGNNVRIGIEASTTLRVSRVTPAGGRQGKSD